jgi:hypothetical protein
MPTATLEKIRNLDLAKPSAPGRPWHLSAASGLVRVGQFIYVVADDELHLGVFRCGSEEPGNLLRLFDGQLPDEKAARKKPKPDLEALVLLPASDSFPHRVLFAVGSGSTPNRRCGAVIALDATGAAIIPPHVVDLSPLLVPLGSLFPALNIEGAVVSGDEFLLIQRGNAKGGSNAIIRYPMSAVLKLLDSRQHAPVEPSSFERFDLGHVEGVPLTFTDASALPDGRIVFTAVSEDTDNTYDDGACKGAVIGMLQRHGSPAWRLAWVHLLDQPHKIEGVDARLNNNVIELLLVTDADDSTVAATLFKTTIG